MWTPARRKPRICNIPLEKVNEMKRLSVNRASVLLDVAAKEASVTELTSSRHRRYVSRLLL